MSLVMAGFVVWGFSRTVIYAGTESLKGLKSVLRSELFQERLPPIVQEIFI
jgi:hypothetical protein